MAIILVLGMLAMTMAISYSLLRTQATELQSSRNSELRSDARNAALSGLAAALRRMNQTNWSGADSTLTGTLSSTVTYVATYTTGDDALATTDPGAAAWPYRVTILSTGYAQDGTAATAPTMYQMQAVAELVPKQVAANPSAWAGMQSYVLYQTGTDAVTLQIPLRIEGAVRFQGSLTNFCTTYPTPSDCQARYLSDLNAMRSGGYADYRPLSGPISLPLSATTSAVRNLLTNNLGLTLTDLASTSGSGWNSPGSPSTYQLYPGGKVYTIPTLPATVSGVSLTPDPRSNPAGLYFRNGDVTLGGNTTIEGTVISTGRVAFAGTNISLKAFSLPALSGSATLNQLPAVVAANDLVVSSGTSAAVQGTAVTFAKFTAPVGSQTTKFDLRGKLICRQLEVLSRTEWSVGSKWTVYWNQFTGQLNSSTPVNFLPNFMTAYGMDYAPGITVAAPTTTTGQQWFTPGSPIYAVGTGDGGLRWSVIRQQEVH